MTIDRPSRDSILMSSAALWALRSTCSRAQVGVVIATMDYRPLVSGYNGAPSGMVHCTHECTCKTAPWEHEEILRILPGRHHPSCKTVQPCLVSVHGEANAIAYAAKEGVRVNCSQLFTTVAPCHNCAMLIINSGIRRVMYERPHRDMSGVKLLDSAAVEVVAYEHEAK